MSKESVSANTEKVFRENETKANHMLTLVLNVTILVVAVTWLLFEIGNMRHAVDGFVQKAPRFDDLTMLCLEYKGSVDK